MDDAGGVVAELLRRPRFEVIPLPGIERDVAAHLPREVKVTVTASPRWGLEGTLAASERIAGHGYDTVPHLAARLVRDREHLAQVLGRLDAAGIREVFVIAGDAKDAAGEFAGAAAMLAAMAGLEHRVEHIGITGYPESHPFIEDDATIRAMFEKERYATYIVSQITFDAAVVGAWVRRVRARGTMLPIHVGVPGVVDRRKLLRISMRIGLGRSARFLQHHGGWLRSLFLPRRYTPEPLIADLAPHVADPANRIAGLHVYTFNELAQTERWRRAAVGRLLASAS
jgi:methylenetetrahydrofolate reductase (NADPH)